MLRKLKLYGELAEFVGHKEFEIQVDNLPKVISFLINNFPEIEQYMNPRYYQVKVGNYTINEEEIHHPIGQEDIHIVPVIAGAGRGARRFLMGVALIGIAIALPGAAPAFGTGGFTAAGGATTGWAAFSATLANVGLGLAIMGVADMLFPLPKQPEFSSEQDPKLSFNFSGTQNTSRAGTPVPIVYGEIVTGSVVISGAIDTQQVQV
tara:strand:+ start:675 stop:1295 length:621 start_codon:yes stop_codon:yes gene_type:complete